jgi:hypothetical protein
MSGANDQSSEAYDRFLTLWSEADANLGVLTAARQEQSRLRANLHE